MHGRPLGIDGRYLVRVPFSGKLSGVTFNGNGLFCFDLERRIEKANLIHTFCMRCDFIALQETHGRGGDPRIIEEQLGSEFTFCWEACSDTRAGGVGLIHRRSLLARFSENPKHYVLIPFRAHGVSMVRGDNIGSLTIINIHIDPALSGRE